MSHKLDPVFFQELSGIPPEEVCHRALCRFDKDRGCYVIEVWGEAYEVYPALAEIRQASVHAPPVSVELALAILIYLIQAKDILVSGEWVSEKDLPGGAMFFRGPHAIPSNLISGRCGQDLAEFRRACENLGGSPVDIADAAYLFRILPRIPVTVLLWTGDSEFDAEAKLLFDRSICSHLPLDVIFGLAIEICTRLSR